MTHDTSQGLLVRVCYHSIHRVQHNQTYATAWYESVDLVKNEQLPNTFTATVTLVLVIIRASAVGEKEVNFPESEIRCQISPLNN